MKPLLRSLARASNAYLIGLMLMAVLTGHSSAAQGTGAGDARSPLKGEAAVAHLKQQGAYDSLAEAVLQARYGLQQDPQQPGTYHARNPAQRLRASFSPEGVQLAATRDGGQAHRLTMKLHSIGYGTRQFPVSAGRGSTAGNRVEIKRSVGGPGATVTLTEWYVNRAGEQLRVRLALTA